MKKILSVTIILLLALALVACGTAYSNGETTTTQITTQAATEPEIDFGNLSMVWVDDQNVPGAELIRDEDYFPTHVTLFPVLGVLGIAFAVNDGVVTTQDLSGNDITFAVGENDTFMLYGNTYVPVSFFRDIFGAGSAAIMSGEVRIGTHVPDDMF